jgi:hypothetical protein
MTDVAPWVPVEPTTNPAAILGPLPFELGSVSMPIPTSVVPAGATGILVFAWAVLSGVNSALAYWHFASRLANRPTNWFSLMAAGDPGGNGVTCNSQAFWLPAPVDRTLVVTLYGNALSSPTNQGAVEIHGYYPGGAST